MRRGDVVVIADRAGGDYAPKPRPAVVVQAEFFEEVDSVVVCLLTTHVTNASLLRIPVSVGRAPSWVMIEKLTSIRRDRVGQVIGHLPREEMLALERSLAVFLGFG